MSGGRWYATAIALGFLLIALVVLGARWQALARRAAAVTTASALHRTLAYQPPQGRDGSSPRPLVAAPQTNGRGVSPDKPVPHMDPPASESQDKPPKSSAEELPAKHSVDLNTAGSAELQRLPGVGPVLAGRILSYRKEHGRFKSVAELDAVKGIGEKKLADISPYVFVK